ncbi:MAG: rhomboid family intramembrane serine protease [Pseudomonadota bacterium]
MATPLAPRRALAALPDGAFGPTRRGRLARASSGDGDGGQGPIGPPPRPGGPSPMGSPGPQSRPSEPAFNVPGVVLALIALMALIHIGRGWLSPDGEVALLLRYAFIPARYDEIGLWPGGMGAAVWTFLTHALLHGSVLHLVANAIWLAAFGSAMARRLGTGRFLAFSAACAVGGALLHLVAHAGEWVPMVGASGAISGHMAGAARFAFAPGGPLSRFASRDLAVYRRPAEPLPRVLRDGRVLGFLGVWFAINFLFGAGIIDPGLEEGTSVAWEAHVGGFLAGLLLFPLFDPVPRRKV